MAPMGDKTRQPDIVLFLTDQQRYDQVGWASGGHFETPNLDRLAHGGVIFENAYSASTTCVPARVALMTGIEPHRVPHQENEWALREGFWTVAHELRNAGYQTALVGKAHFAPVHADHGFDTLRLCEHLHSQGFGPLSNERNDTWDDYHHWLLENGYPDWRVENMARRIKRAWKEGAGVRDEVEVEAFPYGPDVHPTGWVEQEAAELLDRRDRARPLFLVVSFPHPHAPYNPPEPYASMFDPGDARLPADGYGVNERLPFQALLAFAVAPTRDAAADDQLLRRLLAAIRGLITQIDDAIGRLVSRLDLSSTLIAFTSDHGDYAGHRGVLGKTPWLPFEDLVRVPLFYSGSGVAGPRVVSSLVQNYDFCLTALDVAGVEPPDLDFDGRSLRALLRGRDESGDAERAVFCCTGMPWATIRHGRYKYSPRGNDDGTMLFDLEADPTESVNLAGDPLYADVRRSLSDMLTERTARPALVIDDPARERGEGVQHSGDDPTTAPVRHGTATASCERWGSVADEIDALTAANRARPDPAVEARLVELRSAACEDLDRWPGTGQPRPMTHAPAVPAPREVTREALTVEVIRDGIRRRGSLIVRGLVPEATVDRLVTDIDRSLDAVRAHRSGAPPAKTAPWYVPFVPPQGQPLDFDRMTVEEHDGMLAADSPRTMFDLIEAYEEAGLRDLVGAYFGDRPVLTVKKTTLRRVGNETGTQWWHQDGAFLGRVGALNVWLSLSHCGDDAPSLDLLDRRIDEILPTGVEGAAFDWSLGRSVVDRHGAGEIVRPRFAPGDALLFDELLVHQTGASREMSSIRYAIESWFFSPSTVPIDRIPLLF